MKVVILAGGQGTRISEESRRKPKPMVEIGGRPILWHIMKAYSFYGYHEFIICCGYKGHIIKEFFVNYNKYQSNVIYTIRDEIQGSYEQTEEPWKVTLAETGEKTLTAGRILRVRDYIGEAPFFLTYCDCVADMDIPALLRHHRENKKTVTISVTRPAGRFGAVKINEETGAVEDFREKARKSQAWVNIGFMVMEPTVFDYLGDGSDMLEKGPFEKLAQSGQMNAYKHRGFWSPMDNMNDKGYLETRWKENDAPWKIWE